jgi:hypothetical protein
MGCSIVILVIKFWPSSQIKPDSTADYMLMCTAIAAQQQKSIANKAHGEPHLSPGKLRGTGEHVSLDLSFPWCRQRLTSIEEPNISLFFCSLLVFAFM